VRRSMGSVHIKVWFIFVQKQTLKAHFILAIEPDGANSPTRIGICLRKQKRKKLVCVVQKPTTASAQTWAGAKNYLVC